MKKVRMLAWLLIIAMLSLACPVLGEELDLEPEGGSLPEELIVDAPDSADVDMPEAEIDIVPKDDIDIDLPELALEADLVEAEDAAAEENGDAAGGWVIRSGDGSASDNDALFEGYVDMLFGKVAQKNGYAGDALTGTAKKIFDYLLPEIKKVAAGTRSDTVFAIPASYTPDFSDATWTSKYRDVIYSVFNALLADNPYHLYWFDKTEGIAIDYTSQLYLSFYVAREYAKSSYVTDAAKIKKAQVAVTNAKKVVKKYAGVSDYEKLCGYRDYICNAVEYNDDAATYMEAYDSNAWQLIWAFDGDSSTNIVCEGYAKAFQYLCDLSAFNGDIRAYSVTGNGGSSPSNSGAHMWNIVTMADGKNYHVDVTFCDTGAPEDFLVGTSNSAEKGEYFYVADNVACYQYDSDTLNTFSSKVLKLSTRDYDPDGDTDVVPTKITITQGKSATLYMGNKLTLKAKVTPSGANASVTWKSSDKTVATVSAKGVVTPKKAGTATITAKTANGLTAKIAVKVIDASSVKLKKGSTTLKKGQKIKLARGKSLTLKGVIAPSKVKTALTWTSSYKYVTVKDGKVTVNKKAKVGAKAKITVKTTNKKTTYIYIVVK